MLFLFEKHFNPTTPQPFYLIDYKHCCNNNEYDQQDKTSEFYEDFFLHLPVNFWFNISQIGSINWSILPAPIVIKTSNSLVFRASTTSFFDIIAFDPLFILSKLISEVTPGIGFSRAG